MQTPPPPTQQQAAEAQQARHAAETAIYSLFKSVEVGGGGGEDDSSVLHAVKIAAILTALSTAIVVVSFRSKGKNESLLLVKPDNEQIAESLLSEAQYEFNALDRSDLDDRQKAILWTTWAYSQAAERVASSINSGQIPHVFADSDLELNKVWISRSDGRVRPLHADLHGKVVPANKEFWRWPHTGHTLRWPGDRLAPPEATIGCRCVCLLTWASQSAVSEKIRRITEHTRQKG